MRVLITGITGFVGGRLAPELQAAGHSVEGLTSDPKGRGGALAEIPIHVADVLDTGRLNEVIESCRPDAVVHLAGLSHVGESWQRPGDYQRVNFVGTRNLMRAVRLHRGIDCKVLFASSAEVYGSVPEDQQPIAENRPLDPRTPYAMTKACAEVVAQDHGALVARSFNAIGPGQSPQFALPSFAAQLAAIDRGEAEPVIRVGDLSPRRDFVHIADYARGYRILLERGEPGEVYNLATGKAHSIAEVLDRLRSISGVTAEIEREESRVRPIDVPVLCGDSARLRALGWEPERSLDEALRDLWQAVAKP